MSAPDTQTAANAPDGAAPASEQARPSQTAQGVAALALLLFPAWLAVSFQVQTGRWSGVEDGLEILIPWLGFCLLALPVLALRRRLLRIPALFLLCTLTALHYAASLLWYRFFHENMPFDAACMVGVVPDIVPAIVGLLQPVDALVLGVVPLVLAVAMLGYRPQRVVLPCCVLLAGLGAHVARVAAGGFYDHDDAIVSCLRGAAEHLNRNGRLGELLTERDALFPLDGTGYRYADAARGVFAREPAGQGEPWPGAPERPNVVLVTVESLRALESGLYGAQPSFTPCLDRLAAESLVFENFYANGSYSARGEFALLASQYPNQGARPHYQSSTRNGLSTLPSVLKSQGYRTHWLCAHRADHVRSGEFLEHHGVDEVTGRDRLPAEPRLLLGLSDEGLFEAALDILGREQQPFFADIVTLSSHVPFTAYPTDADAPKADGPPPWPAYTRGLFYADAMVGKFLSAAEGTEWGRKTLFVITSDHGLSILAPGMTQGSVRHIEATFRVPLLVRAPWLRPARIATIGAQVDVAPTVLHLLGVCVPNSFLGRSLLNEAVPPASRHALLLRTEEWFARTPQGYLYGRPPDGEATAPSLGFSTEADLLGSGPVDYVRLPERQVRSLRWRYGRAILLSNLAVQLDRAWTPPEGRGSSSD